MKIKEYSVFDKHRTLRDLWHFYGGFSDVNGVTFPILCHLLGSSRIFTTNNFLHVINVGFQWKHCERSDSFLSEKYQTVKANLARGSLFVSPVFSLVWGVFSVWFAFLSELTFSLLISRWPENYLSFSPVFTLLSIFGAHHVHVCVSVWVCAGACLRRRVCMCVSACCWAAELYKFCWDLIGGWRILTCGYICLTHTLNTPDTVTLRVVKGWRRGERE